MTYPPLGGPGYTPGKHIVFSTAPKTASGGVGTLDAPIVISSDAPSIVALQGGGPTSNSSGSFNLLAPGVATITFTDTSEGAPLDETVQITVTPDPAVTFGLSFSPPA